MTRYFSDYNVAVAYSKSTGLKLMKPYRRLIFRDGKQEILWAVQLRLAA